MRMSPGSRSSARDARGRPRHARGSPRRPDPVIIFEHAALYNLEGELAPGGSGWTCARRRYAERARDVSLVAYGGSCGRPLDAAEQLASGGIAAEVVDLRVLRPIDSETLIGSVRKTHRAVVIDEGWKSVGLSAEIVARIMEQAFYELDAPVLRVCTEEVPIPYPKHLEDAALPQAAKIVAAVGRSWAVMIEFKLPSLGADMDRGRLIEWKVKPGDRVKRGDVVAVVDTSKAAIDVECWDEGSVYELLLKPDETVPVGTVIATLVAPGERAEEAERQTQARPAETPSTVTPPPAAPLAAATPASVEVRRRISPAARKRAAELGINLAALSGTGPQGAVTLEDVEEAATAKAPLRDRTAEMRRTIALAMARSKREIPHYYLAADIPLARASAWLSATNEGRPVTERLLMAVLLLKAVAHAARKFPDMNGFYVNDRFQGSDAVHVGVAISLRQGGLIAPAIHDTDRKDLPTLMRDLADLVRRAQARCGARSFPIPPSPSPIWATRGSKLSTV